MEEISLIEAWSLWRDGVDITNRKLWGLEILWWGRIGKFTQFFAACLIIAEIIGARKIREFGENIGKFSIIGFLGSVFTFIHQRLIVLTAYLLRVEETKSIEKALRNLTILLVMASGLLFTKTFLFQNDEGILEFYLSRNNYFIEDVFDIVMFPFYLVFFTGYGLMMLGGFIAITITIPLTLLEYLVIKPTARLLDNERIEIFVKMLSILLVIFGFHFDFLAS